MRNVENHHNTKWLWPLSWRWLATQLS